LPPWPRCPSASTDHSRGRAWGAGRTLESRGRRRMRTRPERRRRPSGRRCQKPGLEHAARDLPGSPLRGAVFPQGMTAIPQLGQMDPDLPALTPLSAPLRDLGHQQTAQAPSRANSRKDRPLTSRRAPESRLCASKRSPAGTPPRPRSGTRPRPPQRQLGDGGARASSVARAAPQVLRVAQAHGRPEEPEQHDEQQAEAAG
jgi:hypothetical protein